MGFAIGNPISFNKKRCEQIAAFFIVKKLHSLSLFPESFEGGVAVPAAEA